MSWPLSEGFRHFVASMPAPVASGWSGRGVGLAPTGKAPPCHGAHGKRPFPICPARDAHAVRAVIYLLKTRPPRLGHRRQTETVVMTLSQASTGPGLPALHGASTLAAATARRFRRYREPGGGWPLRPAPGRRVPPLGPSAGQPGTDGMCQRHECGTAERTALHRLRLKVEKQVLQLAAHVLQGSAVAAAPSIPDCLDQVDDLGAILLAGLV